MKPIKKRYIVNAPIKQVYELWISNETIIAPTIKLDIKPEAGGHFIMDCQSEDQVLQMQGTFKQVIPYQKLEYSWEWNKDAKISHVSVAFVEKGDATRIVLKHKNLSDQDAVNAHSQGWDNYISGLKKVIAEKATTQK